jgi:hypothetical protein
VRLFPGPANLAEGAKWSWALGDASLIQHGILRKRTCRMSVQVSHIFQQVCGNTPYSYRSVPPASTARLAHPAPALELSSSPPPPTYPSLQSFKLRGSGTWRAHLCLLWGSSKGVAEALFLCRVVPLMHLRAQDSKQPRSFYSRPRSSIMSFSSRSGCERQECHH